MNRTRLVLICLFAGATCSASDAVVGGVDGGSPCDRYVAAVSGAGALALLDDREVGALAAQAPAELVMCGAVRSDSDALCTRLLGTGHGPIMACRHMRSIFHELRGGGSRSFMFGDADWEECRAIPLLGGVCDSLRGALRSGDPKECATAGGAESICRAYFALDGSLCRVEGKLAVVESLLKLVGVPGLEEGCRRTIESRAFLAQGLGWLAESGPPLERELARAALARPDACASFAQPALASCLHRVATGPAGPDRSEVSGHGADATKTPLVPVERVLRAFVQAAPNPVPVGARPGATRVSWNTGDGADGRVRVSRDGASEKEFGSGSQGSEVVEQVAPGSTYEFRLYRATEPPRLLASVRVTTSGAP